MSTLVSEGRPGMSETRVTMSRNERGARSPGARLKRSRRPLSDPGEVSVLLEEYARTRDLRIRDRVVAMHERLVHGLASRFTAGPGSTPADLIQVAYIGLIEAIDRFNPELGCAFTTFAVPTIVGLLKRYLRDQG